MSIPYQKLSEASGIPIAEEAASMMVTRYLTARDYARGKRTLELACASGPGLGLLSRSASFLVGADINSVMLENAQAHYRGRVPLARLSAEALPFGNGSFDFVLLLEASYYVPDFERAVGEMDRVLAPGGRLFFANANPERPDFIRSPHSHTYHSADALRALLSLRGYSVDVFGAFPIAPDQGRGNGRLTSRLISVARRVLEALHLVPNTLEGRARLKRLLGQRLRQVPPEIDETFAPRGTLTPLSDGPVRDFKIFYVSATRRAT